MVFYTHVDVTGDAHASGDTCELCTYPAEGYKHYTYNYVKVQCKDCTKKWTELHSTEENDASRCYIYTSSSTLTKYCSTCTPCGTCGRGAWDMHWKHVFAKRVCTAGPDGKHYWNERITNASNLSADYTECTSETRDADDPVNETCDDHKPCGVCKKAKQGNTHYNWSEYTYFCPAGPGGGHYWPETIKHDANGSNSCFVDYDVDNYGMKKTCSDHSN